MSGRDSQGLAHRLLTTEQAEKARPQLPVGGSQQQTHGGEGGVGQPVGKGPRLGRVPQTRGGFVGLGIPLHVGVGISHRAHQHWCIKQPGPGKTLAAFGRQAHIPESSGLGWPFQDHEMPPLGVAR